PAGMTGSAVALDADLEPDGILVAIGAQFGDPQEIAGRLALFPQLLPRARPEMRNPGVEGARKRFRVHMGKHEQLAIVSGTDHGRDQPIRIETRGKAAAFLERMRIAWRGGKLAHGVAQLAPPMLRT